MKLLRPHEKAADHSQVGPGGETQVSPPTAGGCQAPTRQARLIVLPLFMPSGEDSQPSPRCLPCPTAMPVPVLSAHLGVNHFHSSAVPHSQHPGVSGEVCPTPGRGVAEHKGLRVLVDLLQPWGDRPAWVGRRAGGCPGPRTRCAGSMGCGSVGELFLAVKDFHRKGALPILGGPQTDGSGTAADSQLPRQVRAAGHKEGQLTPHPFPMPSSTHTSPTGPLT